MGEKDYDPVMHTAEHLVNGTIARMLGCGRAFSTHIEKKKSKCDFRFPRNLTPEELERVEQTVNSQIAAKLGVRDELLTGAMLFSAVFLLNEPYTCAHHRLGRILYGVLVGAITMGFRYYGVY